MQKIRKQSFIQFATVSQTEWRCGKSRKMNKWMTLFYVSFIGRAGFASQSKYNLMPSLGRNCLNILDPFSILHECKFEDLSTTSCYESERLTNSALHRETKHTLTYQELNYTINYVIHQKVLAKITWQCANRSHPNSHKS